MLCAAAEDFLGGAGEMMARIALPYVGGLVVYLYTPFANVVGIYGV